MTGMPKWPHRNGLKYHDADRNGYVKMVESKPKRPHLYIETSANITFIYIYILLQFTFISLEITSLNITLKTNPHRPIYTSPEYYIENKQHTYMFKNNMNEYYIWKQTETTPFIYHTSSQYNVENKHNIYMFRNNINEYHFENKPKWPHLYINITNNMLKTNITFICLEITSTNITLKTNRNGPICISYLSLDIM